MLRVECGAVLCPSPRVPPCSARLTLSSGSPPLPPLPAALSGLVGPLEVGYEGGFGRRIALRGTEALLGDRGRGVARWQVRHEGPGGDDDTAGGGSWLSVFVAVVVAAGVALCSGRRGWSLRGWLVPRRWGTRTDLVAESPCGGPRRSRGTEGVRRRGCVGAWLAWAGDRGRVRAAAHCVPSHTPPH